MAGNWLANWGLVQQGMNDSRFTEAVRDAELERMAQMARAREGEIAAQGQTAREREQQIGLRQIGLEEAKRQADTQGKIREAVSGLAPDSTKKDSYNAMLNVYRKTGDWKSSQEVQKLIDGLDAEGFGILARAASLGEDPASAAKQFNRLGNSFINPDLHQWLRDTEGTMGGEKNDVWSIGAEGQKFNTSQYIRLTSPKPDVHIGQPGSVVVQSGPGRPTTITTAPGEKSFEPRILKYHDSEGKVTGETLVSGMGQELYTTVGKSGDAAGGGARVKEHLPEIKAAMDALESVPGMVTSSNPNNPLDTQKTLTAEGLLLARRLSAFVMSNPSVPPHNAIEIVMKGQRIHDARGNRVLSYGGKTYPVEHFGGEAPATRPAATGSSYTLTDLKTGVTTPVTNPADISAIEAVSRNVPGRVYPAQGGEPQRFVPENAIPGLVPAAPQPAPAAKPAAQTKETVGTKELAAARVSQQFDHDAKVMKPAELLEAYRGKEHDLTPIQRRALINAEATLQGPRIGARGHKHGGKVQRYGL